MAREKVLLKDIADRAGVSTTLVSFVLNHKGRVGEETARHIMKIAEEMNYRPNQAAKSLRSGRSGTIGVVLSDVSNPFFALVARHIEDEVAKSGYAAFFSSSDEKAGRMGMGVENLLDRGVDGLIVVPCEHSEESIRKLVGRNVPLVLFDRSFPDLNVNSVTMNNFAAAYAATKHLVESGRASVGMVAYDLALSHMRERVAGYKKAMADLGFKNKVNVGYLKSGSLRKSAAKTVDKLIEGGCDALLFATNTISLACMHHVTELGVSIPEELAVVAFDGSDTFDFFYAPLTYVKQPVDVLARKAVEIIINAIESNAQSVQSVVIDGELVVRASSL